MFLKKAPLMTKINFELTSKCALSCLRCARTEEAGHYQVTELPLDLIKKRFPPSFLKDVVTIDLSGNYGDPIYHSKFHEVLKYFKDCGCQIYMETNGSHRTKDWWERTLEILSKRDMVVFSVDGLKDTNHLYRKNAKWESVEMAMRLVAPKVNSTWKYILFSHNEHQLEEARELAAEVGFRKFKEVKSSLFYFDEEWGFEKDTLMPSLENISDHLREKIKKFRKEELGQDGFIEFFSRKPNYFIDPKCESEEKHYFSATGLYFPCCWLGHHRLYEKTFIKGREEEISLYHHSVEEILNSRLIRDLKNSWKSEETVPEYCRTQCPKSGCRSKNSQSSHQMKTDLV